MLGVRRHQRRWMPRWTWKDQRNGTGCGLRNCRSPGWGVWNYTPPTLQCNCMSSKIMAKILCVHTIVFNIDGLAWRKDGKSVFTPKDSCLVWVVCYFDTGEQWLPASGIFDIDDVCWSLAQRTAWAIEKLERLVAGVGDSRCQYKIIDPVDCFWAGNA